MTGNELRERFLAFFEGKGHRRVPSSSLVPGDDPTLLFTNAGMNQFKEVFLGHESRDYLRATSSQKCLRVSGKHNDLEEVGRTARHHTFFEMLGNFSFGDYFKRDAIVFAREFLVEGCGIPFDRLWFTVYDGEGGFPPDDDAHALWIEAAGAPESRVLRLGEKDNFWRMGDTGPCGPCTEIHFDQGPGLGCGREECDPGCDCDRYLEIWNLVFMQYEQRADGNVRDLPAQSVDTGMGLERLAAVVQGVSSNYESDLFQPIIRAVAEAAGRTYGDDPGGDTSLRVIADHLRAVTFLVGDGVTPSNADRGYVVRRILRRACTHAWLLGRHPPFLYRFVPVVAGLMEGAYPELVHHADYIARICRLEEESFGGTLERGMGPLEGVIQRARDEGRTEIPGEWVFPLYDSMGLPRDQIIAAAQQAEMTVEFAGFEKEMERQRQRARSAAKGTDAAAAESYRDLAGEVSSGFVGYDTLEVDRARVLAILSGENRVPEAAREGTAVDVVLDRTPFYAEAGGQIGDVGTISSADGRARVISTFTPAGGLIVHRVEILDGRLREGDEVSARVDPEIRPHTMRNHTATHLLHAALQEVLGPHARQAGSYVGPDRLRFDFNHFQGVTPQELDQVEDLVNRVILDDREVTKRVMDRQQAMDSGAIAFFGEKYGDRVRVVDVPEFSRELCGGTHCDRTGQIGAFRIVSERGISAGVRRIEAVTGMGALRRFRDGERSLDRLTEMLGANRDGAPEILERTLRNEKQLEKEVERLRIKLAAAGSGGAGAAQDVREVDGVRVLAREVQDLDRPAMRNLADSLKAKIDPGIVVLGTVAAGKAALLVSVSEDLSGRIDAREVIRQIAPIVGGGGGGHATMAEAGGKDPGRLGEALGASVGVVSRLLGVG